jgi:hypothetical protein
VSETFSFSNSCLPYWLSLSVARGIFRHNGSMQAGYHLYSITIRGWLPGPVPYVLRRQSFKKQERNRFHALAVHSENITGRAGGGGNSKFRSTEATMN